MTDVDDARADQRTPGGAILMDGIRLRDEITEQLAAEMVVARFAPCLSGDRPRR